MLKSLRLFREKFFSIFYIFISCIMSKKIVFLAAGYLLGGVVSSLYNKKNPEDIQKELKKARKSGDNDATVFVNNFIETHKNLIESLKAEALSDKNKKRVKQKADEFMAIVESYKEEGLDLVENLKSQWKEYLVEASDQLEKLYEEKKAEIQDLKNISPTKAKDIKSKLLSAFEDMKKKIK